MKYTKPEIISVGKVIDITFGGMGWGGDFNATANKDDKYVWGPETEAL